MIVDAPSRESRFDKFTSWCSEHNVACDKVELASFDGLGVGVRATQRIQVGLHTCLACTSCCRLLNHTMRAVFQSASE